MERNRQVHGLHTQVHFLAVKFHSPKLFPLLLTFFGSILNFLRPMAICLLLCMLFLRIKINAYWFYFEAEAPTHKISPLWFGKRLQALIHSSQWDVMGHYRPVGTERAPRQVTSLGWVPGPRSHRSPLLSHPSGAKEQTRGEQLDINSEHWELKLWGCWERGGACEEITSITSFLLVMTGFNLAPTEFRCVCVCVCVCVCATHVSFGPRHMRTQQPSC